MEQNLREISVNVQKRGVVGLKERKEVPMPNSNITLKIRRVGTVMGLMLLLPLLYISSARAQDRDRDRDFDRNNDRVTTIVPGTVIPVRLDQTIDVDRSDNRVFTGMVDQDVRGDDGHLAIPRGSRVELMVRVARDNDLILDLDSVSVNGERYAVAAGPNRQEAEPDYTLLGSIVGAVTGAQGRTIRIPRDSVVTFRVSRPMDMGVADRGVDREGIHYHDWHGYGR